MFVGGVRYIFGTRAYSANQNVPLDAVGAATSRNTRSSRSENAITGAKRARNKLQLIDTRTLREHEAEAFSRKKPGRRKHAGNA